MNIQDKNVQELTDAELQALLKAKGRLAKKIAQREINRRKKLSQATSQTKSSTGSQDFRKGGMVLSTVDNRKRKTNGIN